MTVNGPRNDIGPYLTPDWGSKESLDACWTLLKGVGIFVIAKEC